MKKRIIEGVGILAAVIAVFVIINLTVGMLDKNTRCIDGEYYNIGDRQVKLTLMTTDGIEYLSDFYRLEQLKVSPFKYVMIGSLDKADPQYQQNVSNALELYRDYTELDDISFLADYTTLKTLDISYCKADDISMLSDLNLTTLDISYTNITDLSALSDFDTVESINICGIKADDFSALTQMDSLNTIYVDDSFNEKTAQMLRDNGFVIEFKAAQTINDELKESVAQE